MKTNKILEMGNFNLKDEDLMCETNPFLGFDDEDEHFTLKTKFVNKVIGKNVGDVICDYATGEIKGGQLIYNTQKVDSERFFKVYSDQVSFLFDLSKTGNRAFGYVANQLKPNTDKVYISFSHMKTFCKWTTKQSVYKGMKELMINKIVMPTTSPGWFFINPKVLFNGNRLAIVTDYQKESFDDINAPEMLH